MTPPTDVPVYRRILVATGGAPHSDLAVERAVTLALRFGATLDVVTVVPVIANALVSMAVGLPGSESLEAHNMESERAVREEVLARTVEFARSRGLPVTGHLVHAPRPADAILGVARDVGADLIVLGRRHTTALSAAVAGSTGDAVSHASPVDVLVAR